LRTGPTEIRSIYMIFFSNDGENIHY
jgi:hypothetical protein